MPLEGTQIAWPLGLTGNASLAVSPANVGQAKLLPFTRQTLFGAE